jgi:hypothetical protein
LISVALLVELVLIPLVQLNSDLLINYKNLINVLNSIWVFNIFLKLQTIKLSNPSDNAVEIAGLYIFSEFVWDLTATLPSMMAT